MSTNSIAKKWGGGEPVVLVLGEGDLFCLSNSEGTTPKEISVPLRLPPEGTDPTPALLLAFEEIRDKLPETKSRRQARVVLLPPLSEGKLLHLPPLRREELEQVVRTTASQHFLRGGVPLVVGVEQESTPTQETAEEGTSPPRLPLLAAAAPRSLADAIYRAISGIGWEIDAILPAHAAWLAALHSREATEKSAAVGGSIPQVLVATIGGTAHLLRLEGKSLTRVRRLPASSPSELLESAGDGPGRILVSSEGTEGEAILAAFLGAGWHPAKERRLAGSPAHLAANHAWETALEMVPPRLAMERRDRVRRLGIKMGIAAGVLFLATAVLLLLGAKMELRALRQYREELRPDVAPLLADADSLFMMEDRIRTIEEIEENSEGWAVVLVELAVLLPQETHLEKIQAAGDTLVLEAVGGRAGEVLEALRQSTTLSDPRLEGTIQRDVEGGEATGERFRLSAIRKEGTSSSVAPIDEGTTP